MLPPELASAGAARRLLRETLAEAGRLEWLDDAALAISEVVANAALHAHTPIRVVVQVRPERLRVEVQDFSTRLPVPAQYDDQASTGRGMGLVAALTKECGVQSLGDEGKVIWFCLEGTAPELDAEDLLAAWDVEGDLPTEPAAADGSSHTVVLRSMPATLWLAARQHHDALLRELVLYLAEHDDQRADVAAADVARRYISDALTQAIDEARQEGRTGPALPEGHPSPLPWVPASLDLQIPLPAHAGPAFGVLQDALDVGERLAVAGRLLVRPGLPEVIAVRDWACEQVVAQLAGTEPSPWPGTGQERFETEIHDRLDPDELGWDTSTVRGSARGVVAADDANRIVAISRPLADLLGWQSGDLVGRRVVTLIPPALREGHVAGFTRHLTTGEAHVLGVPLRLPVLRADGSEVLCDFLVESAPRTSGRPVYLAWIEPVPD